MRREDLPFLGVVHPYRGTMIYTVTSQGMRNSSLMNYDKVGRIYGDLLRAGDAAHMADSILPLGDTAMELLANLREVLTRARMCGLTFKPSKVIITPKKTQLFGWQLEGSKWTPLAHTVSSLTTAERPMTIKGLRSFLGSFKQISQCVKGYANILHTLEEMVAGKPSAERLVWQPHTDLTFKKAREAAGSYEGIHVP